MHTDVRCDVVYIPRVSAAGGRLSAGDIFFVINRKTARPVGFRFGRPRTVLRRARASFLKPIRSVYRAVRRVIPRPFRALAPRWAGRRTVFQRR